MDVTQITALVKERLGIRSTVRDIYLTAITESVVKELEDEKGLKLDADNSYHLLFCVDYATWRYQSVNNNEENYARQSLSMPRHLQFRLHNLMIHVGGIQ
jgi:hypothetical protein